MKPLSDQVAKWLNACVEAAKELAAIALTIDQVTLDGFVESIPEDRFVALIALAGATSSVQLGLAATANGCQTISKTLIGMEPSDPDLEPGEVADAMGEAANILAGQVKSLMVAVDPSLNLGIPIFLRGQIDKSSVVEAGVANLHLGDIPVSILVLVSSNHHR